MADKKFDVDGADIVTPIILDLLNQYPGLMDDEKIIFSTLSDKDGLAMFPTSAAAVLQEIIDVTDHVTQRCSYPFTIVYRAGNLNKSRRANIKEWLDDWGRWLEKQTIYIDGQPQKLKQYPKISGRKIEKVSRNTSSYLQSIAEDKTEDWVIAITAQYTNEFDR